MISIAEQELSDVDAEIGHTPVEGVRRFIRKDPLGVVLTISGIITSPMSIANGSMELPLVTPSTAVSNFSLIAINTVLPALLAGNAVIQKPSPQTPLVAERFQEFYQRAGLPSGLLQTVHLGSLPDLEALVARPKIMHVAFTGSVAGGSAVQKAAINSFKSNTTPIPIMFIQVCVWS